MSVRALTGAVLFGALVLVVWPVHAGDAALAAARKAAQAAPRAAYVSRDEFMQKPDLRDISMSPDGKWLAYRRFADQRLELWIQAVSADAKPGKHQRVMSDSEGTDVYWSGDGARLWLVDADGLGVFDVASGTGRRIFRFDHARQQSFWMVDAGAPSFAVAREKVPVDGAWVYRYFTIDAKGKTRVIHESPKALVAALLGVDGNPRYLAGYNGPQFDTVIWKVGTGKTHARTREIMRCPIPQQCRPVAYSGNTVWALAHHGQDLMALQEYDAATGKWKVLNKDPRNISDALSVLMQPDGKDWFAVAYRPDRVEWHGRSKKVDAQIAALQAKLPDTNLAIEPDNAGNRWLVQASKSNWQYDRYFLLDAATNVLTPLFQKERAAPIPAAQMATMLPLHWRDSHGVVLHGYAFLPKGVPLDKAPLMAFIHGGPYNHTYGTMDVGTQLMVNRGYIVFKPNFRASTGYGVKYATGSGGNFGKHGGALDDIISGLDYLLDNGIGDPQRQAIVGHSFGGYASLLAVTNYPHRFAFAVPSAAPVDFAWVMEDVAVEGGSALSIDGPTIDVLLPHYGVPYADSAWRARMHRESPLAHAAQLRTPVYLWAGAKDDRVAVASLVRYVATTNPQYRPTLLIDPDSEHSPHQRLNSEALAWLIEAAANQYFGGGVTPPSVGLQAFIDRNLHRSDAAPLSKGPRKSH